MNNYVSKDEIFEFRLARKLARVSKTKLKQNPYSGNLTIGGKDYAQLGTGKATTMLGASARLFFKKRVK